MEHVLAVWEKLCADRVTEAWVQQGRHAAGHYTDITHERPLYAYVLVRTVELLNF